MGRIGEDEIQLPLFKRSQHLFMIQQLQLKAVAW